MKPNKFFILMMALSLPIFFLFIYGNDDLPMPVKSIPAVFFGGGLIGYIATRPSKKKKDAEETKEELESRLRDLELRNKIAEAEDRLKQRGRDA